MSATPAQMHELLSSALSCLARLAILSGLPVADGIQQVADREAQDAAAIAQPDNAPVQLLGDKWRAMQHASKLLDRISDSLDVGNVAVASAAVMQLCTSIIERHNRERKLFFSTGRAAKEVATDAPPEPQLVRRCEQAVTMLDNTAPQIRSHFVQMSAEDEKMKALQFMEEQRKLHQKQRVARLALLAAKGQAVQQRKLERRRRAKEKETRALAAEIELQKEAQIQYHAYQQAKAKRHAQAEQRIVQARREKFAMMKEAKEAAKREDRRLVSKAQAKRAARVKKNEERAHSVAECVRLPHITKASDNHLPPIVQLRQTMELEKATRRPSDVERKLDQMRRTCSLQQTTASLMVSVPPAASTVPPPTVTKKKTKKEDPPHHLPIGEDGEFVTAWDLIKSSETLNTNLKDSQARMHTCLGIETPGALKYVTEQDADLDGEIDVVSLSAETGLSLHALNNYLAIFTLEQKGLNKRPMKFDKFKNLMRKLRFTNSTIVKRMFEVFDVSNDGAINFSELCKGLSFFVEHAYSADYSVADPQLFSYMTKFLDLDGSGNLSQFELYKILQGSLPKDYFSEVSEVIWDVMSNGVAGDIEFNDFKVRIESCPDLKRILHRVMLLQGTVRDSYEYQQQLDPILELTEKWRSAKAAGRINSLDNLAHQFMRTSDATERALLAFTADTMAAVKRGEESLVASYYVKVMRMILDNGPNYVAKEYNSICDKLKKLDKEVELVRKLSKLENIVKEEPISSQEQRATLKWKKSVMDVFMGSA